MEEKFQEFLEQSNIPYWYIQQDIKTFSSALKIHNTKRPDFLVLLPNFGSILVDVKDKPPLEKYKKICLLYKDIIKYKNLQQNFNLQVWFAVSNKQVHYETWYWIPATRAYELSKKFLVKSNQIKTFKKKPEDYVSIPISEYIQTTMQDNISKVLYQNTKRFCNYG